MCADAPPTGLPAWTIDPDHNQAQFSAKHFMIATVAGLLGPITGTLHFDPDDLTTGSAEATIDVTALSTGHKRRDADLRSANFFDVEHYPTIWFRSTRVLHMRDGRYLMRGELTIKGVTRSVTLAVSYEGQIPDPYEAGSLRAGFTAETTLSRKEFAIIYDPLLQTGVRWSATRLRWPSSSRRSRKVSDAAYCSTSHRY
jgi:polyisoprenoid-binding protein YceI